MLYLGYTFFRIFNILTAKRLISASGIGPLQMEAHTVILDTSLLEFEISRALVVTLIFYRVPDPATGG